MKKARWLNLLIGLLIVVAGILTIIFAVIKPGQVDRILSIVIAVSLFITGISLICTALLANVNDIFNAALISGSAFIGLGIVLVVVEGLISSFLIFFLGAFLLSLGVVSLLKAISFITHKQKANNIAGAFIIAAVAIILGILLFVFQYTAVQFVYVVLGISILSTGIAETVYGAKLLKSK